MGIKIAAIYKDGAFIADESFELIPETLYSLNNSKIWIEIDHRFDEALPKTSALYDAQREFAIAFANGGWDEARVRAGCRLAWNAVEAVASEIVSVKGWTYETPCELESLMRRLDEEESEEKRKSAGDEGADNARNSMRWWYPCNTARTLLARANGEEDGYTPYMLDDVRDFAWHLQSIDRFITEITALSARHRLLTAQ